MVCGGPGGCCFLGALVLAACAVGVFLSDAQLLELAVETWSLLKIAVCGLVPTLHECDSFIIE